MIKSLFGKQELLNRIQLYNFQLSALLNTKLIFMNVIRQYFFLCLEDLVKCPFFSFVQKKSSIKPYNNAFILSLGVRLMLRK